jgi:hypothetical protein
MSINDLLDGKGMLDHKIEHVYYGFCKLPKAQPEQTLYKGMQR